MESTCWRRSGDCWDPDCPIHGVEDAEPEYVNAIGNDESQAALDTRAAPRDAMVLVAGREGLAYLD